MSAKILKALTEDPQQLEKQLEKEIGCMTGVLQIFDRQNALTGRRFGHRRLSGARSMPTSSCGSPRFDGSGSANFSSFAEDKPSNDSQKQSESVESKTGASECTEPSKTTSAVTKEVPRVSSEMKLEPGRASLGSKEPPRLSFYFKDLPPSSTEVAKDPPRNSIAGLTAKERAKLGPSPSGKDQPRGSYDSREQGRPLDIRDVVRASFSRDSARAAVDASDRPTPDARPSLSRQDTGRLSVDGKELPRTSFERRESARNLIPRSIKEPPRASLDGREISRSSMDLRDTLKALNAKYHRDAGRLSVDGRDAPRSSLDLKSRDGPRYSVDGRDAPRFSLDSREALARSQQKGRDAPRLSADGRDGPRHSVDQRDLLLGNLQIRESANGYLQSRDLSRTSVDSRSSRASCDSLGSRDRDLQRFLARDGQKGVAERKSLKSFPETSTKEVQANADTKRRVPNVVARLMGLEELPAAAPPEQHKAPQVAPCRVAPPPKKPSTEAKLLQELLQYKPLDQPQSKAVVDQKQSPQTNRQSKVQANSLDSSMFAVKNSASRKMADAEQGGTQGAFKEGSEVGQVLYRQVDFRSENFQQSRRAADNGAYGGKSSDHPRVFRNFTEPMPPASKQQEAKEMSHSKYAQLQKQFPEAILTVLKHSEEVKKQQQSSNSLLGELEERLQLLRVKNSQQERKTLRQILEAMQLKGLLHPPRVEGERPSDAHQSKGPGLSHQDFYGGYYSKRDPHYQGDQSPRRKSVQDLKAIQDMRAYQQMRALEDNMIEVSIDEGKAMPPYGKQASIVLMKPVTRQQQAMKLKAGETRPMGGMSARGVGRAGKVSGLSKTLKGQQGLAPITILREPISKFNSEETVSFRRRRDRPGLNQAKDMHPVSGPSDPRQALRNAKAPVPAASPKGKNSQAKELPTSKQQGAIGKSTASSRAVESGRKQRVSREVASLVLQKKESQALGKRSSDSEPRKVLRRCSSDLGSQSVPADGSAKVSVRLSSKGSDRGKQSGSLSDSETCRRAGSATKDVTSRVTDQVGDSPIRQQLSSESLVPDAVSDVHKAPGSKISKKMSPQSNAQRANSGSKSVVVRPSVEEAKDHSFDVLSLEHLASTLPYPDVSIDKFEQEPNQAVSSLSGGSFSNFKTVLLNQDNVKYLGEGMTDGAEQPSPVSVLDAPFQDEDHSPRAINKNIVSLKDAQFTSRLEALANEFTWEEQVEERVVAAAPCPAPCSLVAADTMTKPLQKVANTEDMFGSPAREAHRLVGSKGEEKAFVSDILISSGLTDESNMILAWHSHKFPIDPELFDRSEEKRRCILGAVGEKTSCRLEVDETSRIEILRRSELEVMDRRLLFDSVNDITGKKLRPYLGLQPWMNQSPVLLRRPPTGQLLVEEVWRELQELPCAPSEDVCDTLYTMLQRDLAQQGEGWLDHSTEIGEVGLELERMIFKELIEEAVMNWSGFSPASTSWAALRLADYA